MSENQKKVWITGASSGIGKSTAEKFAKEGWKVAISARRKEILDDMAKNPNISSYPLDVVNEDNCKNTFLNIIAEFKEIDLCIFVVELTIRIRKKRLILNRVNSLWM